MKNEPLYEVAIVAMNALKDIKITVPPEPILSGPESGFLGLLHGTELVVPLEDLDMMPIEEIFFNQIKEWEHSPERISNRLVMYIPGGYDGRKVMDHLTKNGVKVTRTESPKESYSDDLRYWEVMIEI